MRAYYVVDKHGTRFRHVPTEIPPSVDQRTAIDVVKGWLFTDGWDSDTTYAIYLEVDNEFKPVAGSKQLQDLEEEMFTGEEKENFLKYNVFEPEEDE